VKQIHDVVDVHVDYDDDEADDNVVDDDGDGDGKGNYPRSTYMNQSIHCLRSPS